MLVPRAMSSRREPVPTSIAPRRCANTYLSDFRARALSPVKRRWRPCLVREGMAPRASIFLRHVQLDRQDVPLVFGIENPIGQHDVAVRNVGEGNLFQEVIDAVQPSSLLVVALDDEPLCL